MIYPLFRLDISDMDHLSRNYWKTENQERNFLESLSRKIPGRVSRQADWKDIDLKILKEYDGGPLINRRNTSITQLLENNFPEFFWENWKIPCLSNSTKKRIFVDALVATSFGFVEDHQSLGELQTRHFMEIPGGPSLLTLNNGSCHDLFQQSYPEFTTLQGRKDYRKGRLTTDQWISTLGWGQGVRTKEDLVDLNARIFIESGSSTLLMNNGSSPQGVFKEMYPELMMEERVQRGYWKDLEKGSLMERALRLYNLKKEEDWYRLSILQFSKVCGKFVCKAHMIRILQHLYPEIEWKMDKFSERMNKRSTQSLLGLKLGELLKEEIVGNYVWRVGKKVYVFDYYVPALNVVIEYQGEMHYYGVLKWMDWEEQRKRDQEKTKFCELNGLQLLYVPYWWDGTADNLREILQLHLPTNSKNDLILNS
eukprot:TRINITY_DN4113_c0_g1_i1.p1 TRINITY_DN4113_c0_g1~~TRINITY_DN4113_c0_g1_i1.p1  ORF type:complete len:485 (-),score=112.12 TRINITY_DN4113_c0_g1_i1:148-1419(-)